MGTLIRYCEICGKQFVPYRDYHKRCSNKCRQIATEKTVTYKPKPIKEKICRNCGKVFQTNNKKKVYCCAECQIESRESSYRPKKATERICKNCGQTFFSTHHAKKFCTDQCYVEAKKIRQKADRNGR